MKKVYPVFFSLALVVLLASCPGINDDSINQSGDNFDNNKPILLQPTASMKLIGTINHVYGSSSDARFYTGQIMDGSWLGCENVGFEGALVAYDDVEKELLDYVESKENNDAMMHQNYPGIEFDSNLKYVEFSTYTDLSTRKIVAYEIRVFWGNFMDTYNADGWYAKSAFFNSTFSTADWKPIHFEFAEGIEEQYSDYPFDLEKEAEKKAFTDMVNTIYYPLIPSADVAAIINKIGTVFTIYNCGENRSVWGRYEDQFRSDESFLVEYSTVQSAYMKKFRQEGTKCLMMVDHPDVQYDSSKTYIEVNSFVYMNTGMKIYDIRLIDHSYFEGNWNGWYGTEIQLR